LDDNTVMSADSYADLLECLFAIYEGRHSLAAGAPVPLTDLIRAGVR
jgi:hypothetical protein